MTTIEKWVIQSREGRFLQRFAINPKTIELAWYIPGAPVKTKAGEKGPLYLTESKAQTLLEALASLVPAEFSDAKIKEFDKESADA